MTSDVSDGPEHGGAPGFAGDLFLRLAVTRRLVLDPDLADQLVAGMTATLEAVTAKCGRGQECPVVTELLDRALVELPKYIQAFRIARQPDVR